MRIALVLALLTVAACGSGEPTGPSVADLVDASDDTAPGTAPDTAPDTAGPTDCPTGHVLGADGECMAVGIQGCIEMFINPDTGLCDPTPDHCPPGSIPIFSGDEQGCRPVGILDCHPDFIDAETGLCDPDPDFCEAGYIPVPTQGCVSLDPPGGCGEGTWGNVEELAGDVHVDVGYAGGDSDGTREKPCATILCALGKTKIGKRMVLAAGEYDEGVLLAKSMSIVGRCSSMVTLAGTRNTSEGPTVIEVKGDVVVHLSDVTISGPGIGVIAHSAAQLMLARLAIVDNEGRGLIAAHIGTAVHLSEALIAGTKPPLGGTAGRGVSVQLGAHFTAQRAVIMGNHGVGLVAGHDGTTVLMNEVLVTRTKPPLGGTLGVGVSIQEGAQATLDRAVIADNHDRGLLARGVQTSVLLNEVLVARTQPSSDGTGGRGVSVEEGAMLSLARSAIVENHDAGLVAGHAGTMVLMSEVLIARTKPTPDGTHGLGVVVVGGAQLSLARSAIVDNHVLGLACADAGSSVLASEVVIAGTRSPPEGIGGAGVLVKKSAQIVLDRVAILDNHFLGLLAVHADALVVASEVLIARSHAPTNGAGGLGIKVQDTAYMDLERAAIVDNHEIGIGFYLASGKVIDTLLMGTTQSPDDPYGFADGLLVNGSEVTATRVVSRGNARVGIFFNDSEGDISDYFITENAMGLANQGNPGVTVAGDNLVTGNDQNFLDDGNLAIPDEAMELPPLPDLD